jgi:hypothetical protein
MRPLALLLAACSADPTPSGDDTDLPAVDGGASLREVAFFQAVEVLVAAGDDAVTPRAAPLIAGRPAVVRAMIDLPNGWTAVELTLSVDLTTAGETRTFSAGRVLDASSEDTSPESGLLVELPADALAADTTYTVRLTTADATHDRFPAADDAPLDALVTGPLKLVLVPFEVNGFVPDTSPAVVDGLRDAVMASLPVTAVEVSVGEVQTWVGVFDLGDINVRVGELQETAMIAGEVSWDTYYYGLATGVAARDDYRGITGTSEDGGDAPVRAFFAAGAAFGDARSQETLVHELGPRARPAAHPVRRRRQPRPGLPARRRRHRRRGLRPPHRPVLPARDPRHHDLLRAAVDQRLQLRQGRAARDPGAVL